MRGHRVRYSDPSFITLGEIVREVIGVSVAEYAREHVFRAAGQTDTVFRPGAGGGCASPRPRSATTLRRPSAGSRAGERTVADRTDPRRGP